MEKYTFSGVNLSLPGYLWCPIQRPGAVVLVLHGMTEHAGRYGALGDFLSRRGVAVAAYDLRGHGQHPGDPSCAAMGPEDWALSLQDIRLVMAQLNRRFPGVPVYLLGFSLGSFLVREYLASPAPKPAGVILMGTGHQPGPMLAVMKWLVNTQVNKGGFEHTTPLVRKLSFGAYNQKFRPNRTGADWLCADEGELDSYLQDPLCRPDIASGLFYELLDSMSQTGRPDTYNNWPKDMPVLLLSGGDDPVGSFAKGVLQVRKAMAGAGLRKVTMHLFARARHDLLHEEASGKAEAARNAIYQWLQQHT